MTFTSIPTSSSAPARGKRSRVLPRALAALLLAGLLPSAQVRAEAALPRLIFVSRNAAAGSAAGLIPGLGPRGRALAPGGRLMVRERDGRVRALLAPGTLWDVSDPCVSWDGGHILFAATVAPDSAWRIWVVDRDGAHLAPLTRSDRALDLTVFGAAAPRFERYDDFDPVWLPDGRVCFASTRWPLIAAAADLPASNLFVVDAAGGAPRRITSERNGAEEPTVDIASGRIVYARWWFNRYLASDRTPGGITTDSALAIAGERVNLWTAVSITPSGEGLRLAAGDPLVRSGQRAYQPAVTGRGDLIVVRAADPTFERPGSPLGLALLRGTRPARALAGFGRGEGCASVCAPAMLPDGRILCSRDRRGNGDYGLAMLDPVTGRIAPLLDLPGTLELDATPLSPRRRPPVLAAGLPAAASVRPPLDLEELRDQASTFRFDCLNVFANAATDSGLPDAPAIARGARIRFFSVLARPGAAGGDTAVLVRETALDPGGAVHQHDLPADVPMFEQVVDSEGRVLMSAHRAAHVAGMNYNRAGATVQCIGCHVGHSIMTPPRNYAAGAWFNASPSADVVASSEAPGTRGARALVDRRTRGPVEEVAWIAAEPGGARARLSWRIPIEVGALVLYAPRPAAGTNLRVGGCEIAFLRAGRVVNTLDVRRRLSPSGTRIECGNVVADAVELRPTRLDGRVRGRHAAALAEVETLARLVP